MNGGKLGSRSGDLDISGGYETVKCHWACHFPNFPLRSRTVRNCAHERYGQAGSSFAQWNRYNPPASPCPRRGKWQPLREERVLKPRLIPKNFSPRWARENRYLNIGRIKIFFRKDR